MIQSYPVENKIWDEMYSRDGIRDHYKGIYDYLVNTNATAISRKEELARLLFMTQGITFTVYSSNEGIERIFPFDVIPRIITAKEWEHIEKGIRQRLTALNRFLHDVYHQQEIINEGIIPAQLIMSCPHFLREVKGLDVPNNIYVHVAGIDLIRNEDGEFYVLEDNLRTPSGVSYMLENREITKRIFPDLLPMRNVKPVTNYPLLLKKILMDFTPRSTSNPNVVLLTPGIFNSAYFEHTFLARFMGVELVEGRDLVVDNHFVYMKTTSGLKRVDVIYRRIDDEFMDPLVFNPNSLLGVPGLISAYRKGNVSLVNAIGNGVADDKAIYAYVPQMIKYYLNEEPILKNVPTFQCWNKEECEHVLNNMNNMVVKKTNESGGYGMLIGSAATELEIEAMKKAVKQDPRSYIAQPILSLSTSPCFIDGQLKPRHIDLRPYALCGPDGIEIVPGGLTRVALREGSLVVNSSQGGGSKDTWVMEA